MIKVSDYLIDLIARQGVDRIFCVTGGGAMHMNHSLGVHPDVEGVFMLHEQGASIAAEAYARIKESIGCCLVTSGPGATNALTGLVGAYIDSIPVIFISGQAKRADLIADQNIRQFGIQEVDIISMVRSYTKYAVEIDDPEKVRFEAEKAIALALNGRPGPVWISVPLDIQATMIDPDKQLGYDSSELMEYAADQEDISALIGELNKAERPVIMLGGGIRLAHAVSEARMLYESLGIPVLTSWNGVDLIEEDHPLYFGRPGAVGQRAANMIMQSADLVLTIGTRLNLLSTGYNYDSFLARAKHFMVDIDVNETRKKNVHPFRSIICDAGSFIRSMNERIKEVNIGDMASWMDHCRELCDKYPAEIPEQAPKDGYVSTYHLVDEISRQMTGDDVYQFTSSGTSVDIAMKVLKLKRGQRAFLTKGLAAMGYDIPASVGSCTASGNKRTICVTGDGSAAMNIQELEVIKRLGLPVKLFIVDNSGYSMIYQSQNGNFKGVLTGCTEDNGLTLPDMKKVAEAFGIRTVTIDSEEGLAEKVGEVMQGNDPAVAVVHGDITQPVLPKQTNYMREDGQMASRPLEEMSPLIDEEELKKALLL